MIQAAEKFEGDESQAVIALAEIAEELNVEHILRACLESPFLGLPDGVESEDDNLDPDSGVITFTVVFLILTVAPTGANTTTPRSACEEAVGLWPGLS